MAVKHEQDYRMVDWSKIKTIDDLKLVLIAIHGEVGFTQENVFFEALVKNGLLGDTKSLTPQHIPIPGADDILPKPDGVDSKKKH